MEIAISLALEPLHKGKVVGKKKRRGSAYARRVVALVLAFAVFDVAHVFLVMPVQLRLQETLSLSLFYASVVVFLSGLWTIRDRAEKAFNSVRHLFPKEVLAKRGKKITNFFSSKKQLLVPLVVALIIWIVEFYSDMFSPESSMWPAVFPSGGLSAGVASIIDATRMGLVTFALFAYLTFASLVSFDIFWAVGRVKERSVTGGCPDGKLGFSQVGDYITDSTIILVAGILMVSAACALEVFIGLGGAIYFLVLLVYLYFIFYVPAHPCRGLISKVKERELDRIDKRYEKLYKAWVLGAKKRRSMNNLADLGSILDTLESQRERLEGVSSWPVELGSWKIIVSIIVSAVYFLSTVTSFLPTVFTMIRSALSVA